MSKRLARQSSEDASSTPVQPGEDFDVSAWELANATEAASHVRDQSTRCLAAYAANPSLVREHANIERATAQGGYGHRQLYELIQNGADALTSSGGRIEVVLTDDALYCANEGDPIDVSGVEAILSSHISMKRGTEIGRFGLGFKSVLGVSATPEFFSRTACFGFDAEDAGRQVREVVRDAPRTPVLRIAAPLDPVTAADTDPVLRELMGWASTVVRLQRNVGDSSWLAKDMQEFPAEFLLFSPHVGTLVLNDRTSGALRVLSVDSSTSTYLLRDGSEQTEWRVFSMVHRPSDIARADAGELSDRDELPLIWAVPTRGRRRRGAFWAFFPTTYETTLSGILNAPWKTNEDRQNLLEGEFNQDLLDAAAELIVRHLPDLVDPAEPGRFLDYLPGRGDEAQQWADRRLSSRVYELAEHEPCLPDQTGALRLPSEMRIHPAGLPETWLDLWCAYPERPVAWCHKSVLNRDRRSRAERLLGNRTWAVVSALRTWVEALVEDESVEASAAAVRLAAAIVSEGNQNQIGDVRQARVVLTESGDLTTASSPPIFLRGDWNASSNLSFVHPGLVAHDDVVAALKLLGVSTVDAAKELTAAVAQGLFRKVDWEQFWKLTRHVDPSSAAVIIRSRSRHAAPLHLRTRAGVFVPAEDVLLPGRVVSGDGTRDDELTVDLDFHGPDIALLETLGVSDGPSARGGSTSETWFAEYRTQADQTYLQALGGRKGRPQWSYIKFGRHSMPGPLSPLLRLSDAGRVAFTSLVLDDAECLKPWKMAHETRRDAYPVVDVESPARWILMRHGRFQTSIGIVSPVDAVGRGLSEFSGVLPVVVLSHALTSTLDLPISFETMRPAQWQAAMERLVSQPMSLDDPLLGRFYAAAASAGVEPAAALVARVGEGFAVVDGTTITACWDRAQFRLLVEMSMPAVLVDEHAAAATSHHFGFQLADRVMSTAVEATPVSAEVSLVDEFPFLRGLVPGVEDLLLVRCSSIRLVTASTGGSTTRSVDHVLDAGRFYWADERSDAALLDALTETLGLDPAAKRGLDLLDQHRDRLRQERKALIAGEPTLAGRLLKAVGSEALRSHLEGALVDGVESLSGLLANDQVAELFLAAHGVDALKELRSELEIAGLEPPATWAGSGPALAFVRDLGFPREYAGFEQTRRSPFLEVEGPVPLRPLHDFQRHVADQLRSLLMSKDKKRALLSLPTGAGKTRVAVQSLVEALAAGDLESPVLWVAQTDELCEQAVQTWADVWRALGPRRPLHVSRLWGSHDAEQVEVDHVVVATIAKLGHVVDRERYEWLSQPGAVVIDEAHVSTAPTYTSLLRWLGLGQGKQTRPLIGLTATPFRGRSEAGADELAARYGRRRLDAGAFDGDPYPTLQDMGVLAQVRHRVLGGSDIDLTDEELTLLRQTGRLPSSVEERLGVDRDRNEAIVESIRGLPDDWTVLVFATSVMHARTLAATLSLRAVPARAISALTPPAARRHYISEFREGRIRVLTNYGVLTEGFDAPAVRAVYVGRPTFSPNVYQQMVGRGLRGPLNGGKFECLIVDVADNVNQYGGELAFRGFDYLWTEV
jgi:superfamily II DNA or RNA helicase